MVHSPVSFKTDKLHLLLPLRETPEDLADNLDGGVRTAIINEYDLQIAVCLPIGGCTFQFCTPVLSR